MAQDKKDSGNDEPVQQSVHVDCPVEEAFELFTERIGEWWPVPGEGELGTPAIWDPPHRVEFTWKSHADETVDVVFSPEGDGTRVTLTHHGWQKAAVMACVARSFAEFAVQQCAVMA